MKLIFSLLFAFLLGVAGCQDSKKDKTPATLDPAPPTVETPTESDSAFASPVTEESCEANGPKHFLIGDQCLYIRDIHDEATCQSIGYAFSEASKECSYRVSDLEAFTATFVCENCELRKTDHHGLVKSDINLKGSDLMRSDWKSADLANPNFSHAALWETDFGSAKLTQADFSVVRFNFASFDSAELNGATFEGAQALRPDFSSATLTNVSFKKAYLSAAIFRNAKLQGVSFEGADLRNADFSFATGVDLSQLPAAAVCGVKMPDGMVNPPCAN